MLGKHLLCKKEVTGEKQKCVQDIKLRGWGDMDIRHEIELDIRIAGATVQGHIYFEKGGGLPFVACATSQPKGVLKIGMALITVCDA